MVYKNTSSFFSVSSLLHLLILVGIMFSLWSIIDTSSIYSKPNNFRISRWKRKEFSLRYYIIFYSSLPFIEIYCVFAKRKRHFLHFSLVISSFLTIASSPHPHDQKSGCTKFKTHSLSILVFSRINLFRQVIFGSPYIPAEIMDMDPLLKTRYNFCEKFSSQFTVPR